MSQSTKDIPSKLPDATPLPRAEVVKESRIRILIGNAAAASRRWWFQTIQGGHLRESLKTLFVVSILTLLIWVWAETQQTVKLMPITFVELRITTSDRDKIVALRDASPKPPVVTIKVTGPKTGVQKVSQDLTSTIPPKVLEIDLGPNLPVGTRMISVLDYIKDLRLFKDSGVTVEDVAPPNLTVDVDSVRTVEVDILPPPSVVDKLQAWGFEPAQVTVRGPSSVVHSKLEVYADLENAEVLKQPGPQTLPSVRLIPRAPDMAAIHLDPVAVQAKLEVKGDAVHVRESMPIQVSGPQPLLDQYRVMFDDKDFLHNVKFIGPKEIIDEMKKPNSPQPYAILTVESADTQGRRTKRLWYANLPKGVSVSPEDERREISFRLEPRQ